MTQHQFDKYTSLKEAKQKILIHMQCTRDINQQCGFPYTINDEMMEFKQEIISVCEKHRDKIIKLMEEV